MAILTFRKPWILSNKSFQFSVLTFDALEDTAPPVSVINNWEVLHTNDDLEPTALPLHHCFTPTLCAGLVCNLLIFLSFLHLIYTAQLIADQARIHIQCLILYSLILLVLPSSHWKSWLCSICFCRSQWKGTTNDTPVGMKTRFQSEIRHLPSP